VVRAQDALSVSVWPRTRSGAARTDCLIQVCSVVLHLIQARVPVLLRKVATHRDVSATDSASADFDGDAGTI
jgi:hypothetical protein